MPFQQSKVHLVGKPFCRLCRSHEKSAFKLVMYQAREPRSTRPKSKKVIWLLARYKLHTTQTHPKPEKLRLEHPYFAPPSWWCFPPKSLRSFFRAESSTDDGAVWCQPRGWSPLLIINYQECSFDISLFETVCSYFLSLFRHIIVKFYSKLSLVGSETYVIKEIQQ